MGLPPSLRWVPGLGGGNRRVADAARTTLSSSPWGAPPLHAGFCVLTSNLLALDQELQSLPAHGAVWKYLVNGH